ncbi:DNA cytosine methyltransferase [Apilactobacillus micheneri]|uniref:DNA (cytosine-5-)-methyltransferase n=1 Tax=Apilactobacillus micheneri TaxID=1899430 RepID=A0A9Q8IME7_9LACO|nr:DNA cytosine methyltransferase [Apilactobacillus micheneri]TPR38726.1 DNA cytosine methyltransferase [Apilactobacillus micheneri]TPR42394.1 DNA cytosine methyltransferase [Apilactobacillus micheneri]TPR43402.1 DNA cytosine methyltransferase [Apilactobacillus micheneri]
MVKKLNSIELFAGVGGLLDGFEKTKKYNLVSAVEWLKPQCETLINRLKQKYDIKDADKRVLNFDIQQTNKLFNGWTDDNKFGSNKGLDSLVGDRKIQVISGGPPCQAYSVAGRVQDKYGMKNDYRNFLFESYLDVVNHYKPKIIVFENVEGILSSAPDGQPILKKIKNGFNNIGYEIIDDVKKYALLDLSEFGVPQKRKRVILVGIRKENIKDVQSILEHFYNNILTKYHEKTMTVKDAIGDLPKIYPLKKINGKQSHENKSTLNGHKARFHSIRDQKIFRILCEDIENGRNDYQSSEKLKELYYYFTGKKSNIYKYHVLRWDKPSTTIPAHLKKDGLRHIHPDSNQQRSITVREAARIQTFDDDFYFPESMGKSFEMIGNAVPPKFANKLAESIYELYKILENTH